jgi:hypothetical protein
VVALRGCRRVSEPSLGGFLQRYAGSIPPTPFPGLPGGRRARRCCVPSLRCW